MNKFLKSFVYASKGMKQLLLERNFKLHLVSMLLVVSSTFIFNYTIDEWMVLTICIVTVIAAEGFNTAIEKLVDLVSPEFNEKAGKVKDISAAAVLIVSIGSLIVMLLMMYKKIGDLN